MAILDILVYPDSTLKQVSEKVTVFDDKFRTFVADLDETRLSAPGCVGIAAPQTGCFQRVALVDVSANPKHKNKNNGLLVLVNPEITEWDGFVKGREGCLSVPDYTGNVMRAETITLEAQDADGNKHSYKCEGFEARAVQHEIDHLDGLLFLERLVSRRNDLFRRKVYKK